MCPLVLIDVSDAVVEGYNAHMRHGDNAMCPYAEGTEHHAGWLVGWYMGKIKDDPELTVH